MLLFAFIACSTDKPELDPDTRSFTVECSRTPYNIHFKFPKSFISIRELDDAKQMDTTDVELNWILDMQYENPEAYIFYDSLNKHTNVIIKAGHRVDINRIERSPTFFTVPAVPLDKVFVGENEERKIVFDSGKSQHEEKTYYKRKYEVKSDTVLYIDTYFITTKWQSTIAVVRSLSEIDLDSAILNYTFSRREE